MNISLQFRIVLSFKKVFHLEYGHQYNFRLSVIVTMMYLKEEKKKYRSLELSNL